MQFSQDRKVNISICIYQLAQHSLLPAALTSDLICNHRHIEGQCQFGVLAVDDDRQPVERLDADLSVFGDLFGCEGLGVLQVPYTLLCGARNEQYAEDRCPDEKAELLHF